MPNLTEHEIASRLAGLTADPLFQVDVPQAVAEGRRLRRRRSQRRSGAAAVTLSAVAALAVAVPALNGARSPGDNSAGTRTTGTLRLLASARANASSQDAEFTAAALPDTGGACLTITYEERQLPGLPCAADGDSGSEFVNQDGLLYGFVQPDAAQVVVTTSNGRKIISDPVTVPGSRLQAFLITTDGPVLDAGFTTKMDRAPRMVPPALPANE
jgi:hypothetical protein